MKSIRSFEMTKSRISILCCLFTTLLVTACVPPPQNPNAGAGGPEASMSATSFLFGSVYFVLFSIVIMYFLVLRPQQREHEQHDKFVKELKKGDEVETAGGIIGKVVQIKDSYVTVEISSGVKVKVRPQNLFKLDKPTEEKKGDKK